jgi:two-component system KDP operon response regulator KdpE
MERRLAERRLAERFRILDSAPDAMVATDLNFLVTYWNPAAEKLYGWRAEEATGRVLSDVVGRFFTVPEREEARQRLLGPADHRLEVVHRRRDGTPVDIEMNITTLRDHADCDSGLVFVCRDITERKRAEDSLRLFAAREEAILNTIPDMIFTLDAQGTLLTFTPARGMTPLIPPSELIGKRVVDVLPAALAARLMRAIAACVRSGESQTVEYELLEHGETRAYESRLALIAPGEVLSIVRDITANRRLDSDSYESVSRKALPRRASTKILAIDHDAHALRFLRSTLEHAGHKALLSSDLDEASGLVEIEEPDLVLLDITVTGKERLQPCIDLWRLSGVPTLVMGTREQEDDALHAMRVGADDFLIKPLSPREVLARIEAALRRSRSAPNPASKPRRFDNLTVDNWNRHVTIDGKPVRLTATEFRLLAELAQADGRVLTHDEILDRVWGPGYAGQYELVRSFVRTLRRKLGDDARHPRFVLAERGVGYRLVKPRMTYPYSLTPQEFSVLYTLTEGLVDHLIIARRLGITEAEVRLHIASILEKMNARSRTEAAVRAINEGIFRRE